MLGRLIYLSTSTCTAQEARNLCLQSQAANAKNQITGALYFADGAFLQYLEGDDFSLAALYHHIRLDTRHKDCKLLDARLIAARAFKSWSMEWLVDAAAVDPRIQAVLLHHQYLPALDAKAATAMFRTLSGIARRSG